MREANSTGRDTVLSPEATGRHYDRLKMLEVRDRTWEAVRSIAAAVRPGMLEAEAHEIVREITTRAGLLRGWHGPHVRFGPNTTKTFAQPSAPDVRLGSDDIFFIDLGPVMERWEGDAGETFVVGSDPEMVRCAHDVRALFDQVRGKWLSERLAGPDLYAFAASRAESMGWCLNLDIAGHRISDFPHKAAHRGSLAEFSDTPATELWILEIQIKHPTREFGAFFEDMLLED